MHTLDTPKAFPGHSVALQLLGTIILWFVCKFFYSVLACSLLNVKLIFDMKGSDSIQVWLCSWISTKIGEVAATAAVSTALVGAVGAVSALFTTQREWFRVVGPYDAQHTHQLTVSGRRMSYSCW
jgi:Amt family ammonium transporter